MYNLSATNKLQDGGTHLGLLPPLRVLELRRKSLESFQRVQKLLLVRGILNPEFTVQGSGFRN